jgi:RHS repeat-associated protein
VFLGAGRGFEEPFVRFERDAHGREVRRAFRNGVDVEWGRDEEGRPTSRRTFRQARAPATGGPPLLVGGAPRREVGAQAYQWRGPDQLAAVVDHAAGPRFFDHDARGRLIRERRPDAVVERAMDAAGNVYRSGDLRDRRYSKGGRLLEADGARYGYDDDGNQAWSSGLDGDWRYHWNGHGMLREVERPDGTRVAYEYDAFARRTLKRVTSAGGAVEREQRFVWDGHAVVHELDRDGAVTTWHWEPEGLAPIAKEARGRRWAIASDHLGTPTEMYDELGALAWKMQLDVFGVPSFEAGGAEECPWRWPGQYEDGETGLYYNRWRFYSPATGRYTSADPLRYAAGVAAHAYVEDVWTQVDPHGLHIASGVLTDSQGTVHNLGNFDSSGGVHSEPKILNAASSQPHLNGGSLEITSLGPRGDGSTAFFRNPNGRAYPAGPLPPCGPRAANCDALLENFARTNNVTITYHWNGNTQVYHPDGRVYRNNEPVRGCG